jgi:hypothetical protein
MVAATKFCQKPDLSTGPKFFGIRSTEDERKKYEDCDNDSDIGVTADGVRPASGAATDAGADKGTADYCSSESEKNAPRAGAEQTGDKT